MKFCQPHWETLRSAIAERGIDHLVAKGGEQAARNAVAELRDGSSIQTFDPLMSAHNAIVANSMEIVGLAVMAPNEDGSDRCPICYLNAEHERDCKGPPCTLPLKDAFDVWIEHAADGAKAHADKLLAAATPDA